MINNILMCWKQNLMLEILNKFDYYLLLVSGKINKKTLQCLIDIVRLRRTSLH
jgi:hypothetical protein